MLSRVRIRGLGVIEDAELELGPGLNVITGETGAGKTMVVSGLGLLLGARADTGLVRAGADRAVVEGEVDIAPDHPAAQRAEAAGGDVSEGLILSRTVGADGRSRAHVGGRAAPVGTLAEIGQHLVAVHGQADQWRLRRPEEHRALLDDFGGEPVAAARTAYQQAYAAWRATAERLARLSRADTERTRRAEMLRLAVQEIERVDPQPGEEDDLVAEELRLAHADTLRSAAQTAHDALAGGDDAGPGDGPGAVGVQALLADAGRGLEQAGEHDPVLAELHGRLAELGFLAADLSGDLASYASGIESDPARLAWVQQRRADVGALLRSYGSSTTEVLAWSAEATTELADLDGSQDALAELAGRLESERAAVGEAGAALSAARTEAGEQMATAIGAELAHLAMGSARVRLQVTQRPDPEGVPGPGSEPVAAHAHGLDDVEIQLAANAGAPPRSVARAASGGELSRVMLAVEVVCAHGEVPTYVFDEVDAGVGGSAALDLGARLARLAEQAQVVVVTHLGQVAAFADRHLVVRKSTDGQVTATDVTAVTGQERTAELARMLGGVADSAAALDHARELLDEHVPDRVRAAHVAP